MGPKSSLLSWQQDWLKILLTLISQPWGLGTCDYILAGKFTTGSTCWSCLENPSQICLKSAWERCKEMKHHITSLGSPDGCWMKIEQSRWNNCWSKGHHGSSGNNFHKDNSAADMNMRIQCKFQVQFFSTLARKTLMLKKLTLQASREFINGAGSRRGTAEPELPINRWRELAHYY